MRFKVPQDVQREDTIIGPITMKQLIILSIGGGIAYAIYTILSKDYFFEVWLIPVFIVSALTISFAFVKVHELTFLRYLLSVAEYLIMPRKRGWQQGMADVYPSDIVIKEKSQTELDSEKKKEKDKTQDLHKLSEILDKQKI